MRLSFRSPPPPGADQALRMADGEIQFRVLVLASWSCLLLIRAYYGIKVRRQGERITASREAIEREGGWSPAIRGLLFVGLVVLLILYAAHPASMRWFSLPVPSWCRWLGFGLSVISLLLLVWVQAALGRHWSGSLQLRREHTLVTTGPYGWVRHPMYSVLMAFMIGSSLTSANLLFAVLTLLSVIVLLRRVGREEAMMLERFGDQYRRYASRTGRFLPRLSREGEESTSGGRAGR